MEIRNQELQLRRTTSENREEWKERNSNFKTSFMRIIIDGLTFLRWPPSLVAFSDPLEMLLSDPKDAIAFILEFGIPQEMNRHNRLKKNEPISTFSTPMNDRNEYSRHTIHQTSPRNDKSQNTSQASRKSSNFNEFYADESVENQGPGSLQTEAFHPTQEDNNRNHRDDRRIDDYQQTEIPTTPSNFRKFIQSFEVRFIMKIVVENILEISPCSLF
jgi:hypothetical protein